METIPSDLAEIKKNQDSNINFDSVNTSLHSGMLVDENLQENTSQQNDAEHSDPTENTKNESETNEPLDLDQNEYKNIPQKEVPMYEKDKGTEYFKNGNIEMAAKSFSKAVLALRLMTQNNEITAQEITDVYLDRVIIPCNLNISLCYYNMQNYESCVTFCNQVQQIDKANIKALLRRSKSYIKLKNYDEAREDLKLILKKEPNNKDALGSFEIVKQNIKEQVQKEIEFSKSLAKGQVIQKVPKNNDPKFVRPADEKYNNNIKSKSFLDKLNTTSENNINKKDQAFYSPNKLNKKKDSINTHHSDEGLNEYFCNKDGPPSPNTYSAFGSESDHEFFPENFDLMKKSFEKNAGVVYGHHRQNNIPWDAQDTELMLKKNRGGPVKTFLVVILDLISSLIFGERMDSQVYY